jgi:hypothetical protein
MKRFTRFDGQLWHREGGCLVPKPVRLTAEALRGKLALCPMCLKEPDRSVPILVDGLRGLGDTFYMKGAVKRLAKWDGLLYIKTPWPQLFWDSPEIRPVNPGRVGLRTQDANSSGWSGIWQVAPSITRPVILGYRAADFPGGLSIVAAMEARAGVQGGVEASDYLTKVNPDWIPDWVRKLPRPIGVIHPPSIRREWTNSARAPKPEYLQAVVDSRPDIFWVSVGWLADGEEWLIGKPLERVNLRLDHGELETSELLALIYAADVAVAGPSFMVPAAMSMGTLTFVIFGGYAPPDLILNPLLADRVRHVAPTPFCACFEDKHDCPREIEVSRVVYEFERLTSKMEVDCAKL